MRDLAIAAACAHLPLRMRRQASQSGQAPSISARILQMFRVYALMVICVSVVESFSLACSTAYDVRARHDSMLTDAKQLYVSHYGLTRPDSTDPEPARLRLSTECISNYSVPVTVPITFLAQPNTNSQGTGRAQTVARALAADHLLAFDGVAGLVSTRARVANHLKDSDNSWDTDSIAISCPPRCAISCPPHFPSPELLHAAQGLWETPATLPPPPAPSTHPHPPLLTSTHPAGHCRMIKPTHVSSSRQQQVRR